MRYRPHPYRALVARRRRFHRGNGVFVAATLMSLIGMAVLLSTAACVPITNDGGTMTQSPPDGSMPPDDGDMPVDDAPTDGEPGGDQPADGDADDDQPADGGATDGTAPVVATSVFDVTIAASSLLVTGITVNATLTVTFESDGPDDEPSVTAALLQDAVNDFGAGAATLGLAGGISITGDVSPPANSGTFALTITDGMVFGDLQGNVLTDPGLFILQPDGLVFDPGVVGVTYQVDPGSSFGFTITGDAVEGSINLIGAPISAAAGTDLFTGTFSGTRRP